MLAARFGSVNYFWPAGAKSSGRALTRCPTKGATTRAASPRWLIACFSAALYSPSVRPSGRSKTGS